MLKLLIVRNSVQSTIIITITIEIKLQKGIGRKVKEADQDQITEEIKETIIEEDLILEIRENIMTIKGETEISTIKEMIKQRKVEDFSR